VLSGCAPVWAFARLVHHFHPASWVATFDPRLGGGVVVATHVEGVKVGNVVSIPETAGGNDGDASPTLVAVVGDPHRGKSVLSFCLIRHLRDAGFTVFRLDCALADGEGTWFLESSNVQKRKARWGTADFYAEGLKVLRTSNFDYVICDLGGVRSQQNKQILRHIDAVVVCHATPAEVDAWAKFARAANPDVQVIPWRTTPDYDRGQVRSGWQPDLSGLIMSLKQFKSAERLKKKEG